MKRSGLAQFRMACALLAGLGGWLVATGPVRAQVVGSGASPGRASWRPSNQWNDGPFYTASHWNAYAPYTTVTNGLLFSEPSAPPYASEPRGLYGAFAPGRGAVLPYAEGFSAYSGFAGWYQATYRFTPTADDVERAKALFLRTGAPNVATVGAAPLVPLRINISLNPPPAAPAGKPPVPPVNAAPAAPAVPRPAIPIYRSSLARP